VPKVNFKSCLPKNNSLSADLKVIVACYGPYLSIKDAAQCLHCSYETAYCLVRSKVIKASRTGKNGRYIIPAGEIVKFVNKNMSP
jgi:excisionase family DNA binding protein